MFSLFNWQGQNRESWQFHLQVVTTDGQVLQTQTAPNYVVPKIRTSTMVEWTLYPVDPTSSLPVVGYQEKLTSSDGQSISMFQWAIRSFRLSP